MIKHGSKTVDTIFVHCSATRPEWMSDKPLKDKVAEIGRWHKDKGWSQIGYHWVIDRDGSVAPGRPENIFGAHAEGHNKGSIGICLIGGHGSSEFDAFEKNYTPEQDAALRSLIEEIKSRTPITKICGHNEVSAKACPGFQVSRWIAKKSPKKSLAESSTMQASTLQLASGLGAGATAIGALEGKAQLLIIAFGIIAVLAAAWVMRERIKEWARSHSS